MLKYWPGPRGRNQFFEVQSRLGRRVVAVQARLGNERRRSMTEVVSLDALKWGAQVFVVCHGASRNGQQDSHALEPKYAASVSEPFHRLRNRMSREKQSRHSNRNFGGGVRLLIIRRVGRYQSVLRARTGQSHQSGSR